MPRPVHFEIQSADPEKARMFYSAVFGWTFQQWEDNPYWMTFTGKDEPGIDGGLLPRQGDAPSEGQPVNAWVCTMGVPDCQQYVDMALGAGGTLAVDRMAVPGVGWLAYVKDPDGNIFGLMESDTNAA